MQNQNGSVILNNQGQFENSGNIPSDNRIAYIMGGIGLIVIGLIMWNHRDVLMDFVYNLTHNTNEVFRTIVGKQISKFNEEQLRNFMSFIQKVQNPPTPA